MEEPLSNEELRELHRITQEAALHAYPNPERVGCPGIAVLSEVAAKRWPADHDAYHHIKHCSPCLREMLALGKAQDERKRKARLYTIAGIAASILLICGIGVWWRTHPVLTTGAAMINFATTSPDRGADDHPPGPQESLQSYPREELTMTVNLPRGSIDGTYEFQITRSEANRREPLVDAIGEARVANGLTTFTARVNLSGVPTGLYVARVRNLPAGGWHSLAVQIR